jgi:hypothetical protein
MLRCALVMRGLLCATGSRWAHLARLAACLLLIAIGADLAADTRCHLQASEISPVSAMRAPRSQAPAASEPCASTCVPDCYCCSTLMLAGPALLAPEPGPLTPLGAPNRESRLQGVHPVPELPPLSLA